MLEESSTITKRGRSSAPGLNSHKRRPCNQQAESSQQQHHSSNKQPANDARKPFPHINEASRRQQSAIRAAFTGRGCGATRASGNHLVIIIGVSVCVATVAASLLLSTVDAADHLGHFSRYSSSSSSMLDAAASQPRADDASMPDSIYKQAPLLFGADIIGDYYTEPDTALPGRPHHSTTTTTSRPHSRQVSSGQQQQQQHSTRKQAAKSKSVASTRLKRNPTSASGTTTKEASDVGPKDMAAATSSGQPAKGGVSVEHMLSSLGLVVEAMKQQTMAMQMMAAASSSAAAASSSSSSSATKGGSSSSSSSAGADKQQDVRSFLESFGEMLTNLRPNSGGPALSRFNHQDSRDAQVDLSSSGRIAQRGGSGSGVRKGGADVHDEQLNVVLEHPKPSTTSTSTSTSTTTPAPTPSTSPPTTPSTTTTTTTTSKSPTTPEPAVSETTTPAPKKKVAPEVLNTLAKTYKGAPNSKGWRRLVPFDYYPASAASNFGDSGELPRIPGLGLGPSYTSMEAAATSAEEVGGAAMQPVVPDMLHYSGSLSGSGSGSGYGGGSQPDNGPTRSVGMPSYTKLSTKQQPAPASIHQQQQHQQQPQLTMDQAIALMQPFMSQHKFKAAVVPASAAEYLIQTAMSSMHQNQPEPGSSSLMNLGGMMQHHQTLASSTGRPPVAASVSAMAAAMVEQMQHQQEQQNQLHHMQLQMQSQMLDQQQHSDEIPKSPALQLAALMNGPQKHGTKSSALAGALKIGERPQFDVANFQMLDSGSTSQQQRKITMMMLQKALDMAQQQQSQQQQQQQQSSGGSESGDLSATASSETSDVIKSPASKPNQHPSSQDQEQRVKVVKVIQQVLPPHPQHQPNPTGNRQLNSFSILGGRFKITPHTQVLHYLLEPSKMILQQALGGFMPGPLQVQVSSGGVGALPAAPVRQRLPRRVYSLPAANSKMMTDVASSSGPLKGTTTSSAGKQQKKASKTARLLAKKVSSRKQAPKKNKPMDGPEN